MSLLAKESCMDLQLYSIRIFDQTRMQNLRPTTLSIDMIDGNLYELQLIGKWLLYLNPFLWPTIRKTDTHRHRRTHTNTFVQKPPNEEFFDELSTHLESLAGYSCPVYITGDFNIHVEDDDQHTASLLDNFTDLRLDPKCPRADTSTWRNARPTDL